MPRAEAGTRRQMRADDILKSRHGDTPFTSSTFRREAGAYWDTSRQGF